MSIGTLRDWDRSRGNGFEEADTEKTRGHTTDKGTG